MHPRARPIGEPLGDNVLMNFGQLNFGDIRRVPFPSRGLNRGSSDS